MPLLTRRRLLGTLAAVAAVPLGGRWFGRRPVESSSTPVAAAFETSTSTTSAVPAEVAPTVVSTTTTAAEPGPVLETLEVIGRDGWRAAAVSGSFVSHVPERITIHHTAVALDQNREAPGRIRGHQRFHQETKGWPDLAYHFMIDRDGNVYEGRPVDVRGDTATEYDPTGHLLPCLEGDYDSQQPTDGQLESLVRLMAWMVSSFGVPVETIGGHRDHASTTCPGEAVYPLLDDLKARVVDRLAEGVELVYLDPDVSSERVVLIEA